MDLGRFQSKLLGWFRRAKREMPWRQDRTPYRVWVSEVMLQQTQVKTVIPYFERWMRELPDCASLAAAPLEKVLRLWEGLGYYSRARNLKRGAEYISYELKGHFPSTREELLKIPGVGPYTAGAIASLAFAKPEAVVDGNVGRVFARLFEMPGVWNEPRTNRLLWQKARQLLPLKAPGDFNEALMELGAIVCLKQNPLCPVCPVSSYCQAFKKGSIGLFPETKNKRTENIEKFVLLLKKGDRILLRRKRLGKVMGGLWELPTFESRGRALADILKSEGLRLGSLKEMGRFRHSYTRFQVTLYLWQGRLLRGVPKDGDFEAPRWVRVSELEHLTFPSVFRRILKNI